MKVFVNHLEQELVHAMHLTEFLDLLQPKKPFAISINDQFIAKDSYHLTLLNENDRIQIIVPVTGG
jgi:sulfur carrier protein